MIVHYITYSDNKWLESACGDWLAPKWGLTQKGPIFLSDSEDSYTFDEEHENCKPCRDMMKVRFV